MKEKKFTIKNKALSNHAIALIYIFAITGFFDSIVSSNIFRFIAALIHIYIIITYHLRSRLILFANIAMIGVGIIWLITLLSSFFGTHVDAFVFVLLLLPLIHIGIGITLYFSIDTRKKLKTKDVRV